MPAPLPRPARIASGLLAAVGACLATIGAADPYQVEVLVFTRPLHAADLLEENAHQPGCLARAQAPAKGAAVPGAPTAVGPERLQLTTEAQALQRSSAGLRVLLHTAWQQDVAAAAGPWVRIGDRSNGLAGCLRAKLTPVPEIEIDLVQETESGERHSLFGTARVRPSDVHYFDHPALGTLVRLDALAPATTDATGVEATPAKVAPASVPAAAPAAPSAGSTTSEPPPPPKKPFRW